MPKSTKKQSKKEKNVVQAETATEQGATSNTEELSKRDFSDLIKQIETEYQLSYWFMKPKWDEWALRLKLYNNQKRDKKAVGDPTLFTTHQTILASLYEDRLSVSFEPREQGDVETSENLNDLAQYDYEEMEKDIADFQWDWDASFFGRGLMMLMEFNREKMSPIPEVWDPMTVLRDPFAKSVNGDAKGRGRARFIGREIRLTKDEMRDAGVYFNFEKLKPDQTSLTSLVDRNQQLRAEAQGYSDISRFTGLDGDNATCQLLEWFTRKGNKLVFVTLGENRKKVVRYKEYKINKIPIIDRPMYPISHDWDGVSVPDLVEDKQRARAKLQNLGIKVAEAGLHPMYVFDNTKITNRAELNFEQNKFIGVPGSPSNVVSEIPRSGLKQDVSFIMETLDQAAQKATATPDIQQGQITGDKRTATELNIVDKKVDTRYSLSAKIFGWSEKRFWQQWYALYKEHFEKDIDEKVVRISGALGTAFRPLRRENIVANIDPDVKVESKIISDAKRFNDLQQFRGYVQLLSQDPNANIRFALKHMGKLSGLKRDVINTLLPPTVDEMIAEDENAKLEANEKVEVSPLDDDNIHIEIHNKLSDTPAKYAHIQAHKRAMILKKTKPELFPQTNGMNPTGAMAEKALPKPVNTGQVPGPITE